MAVDTLRAERFEDRDDLVGTNGLVNVDGEALAGELVDHVEHLNVRPWAVVSNWKSIAHNAFGRVGHIAPTWVWCLRHHEHTARADQKNKA